ncbi:MAG: NADH-quinone oxidoreductase subunit NuoK [Cyclobacteriaceae bacterium]|nr:NADH-quinone oxidoreductase subunit NuoK [Cyclobacteriaceae bacterium]
MSLESGLILSGILFMIGLTGVMIRRNIIFMLLSVEIMLNAAGIAFIFAGSSRADPNGQIMFLFILAVAAAEVAIGLALVILIYQKFKTLDIDGISFMKG